MFLSKRYVWYTICVCMVLVCLMAVTGCRGDEAATKAKIESIEFDKPQVTIKINEETTVKVIAKSDEAKKNEKIAYTSVNEGVIEIKEPTNDGFIIKGLKGGSTVIMAKSKQVTSYLEIVVSTDAIIAHYVNVGNPVIEVREKERKTTQVTLFGGNALDNNDFRWRLENGKDNIRLDATANIGVIEGLQRGYQKIIVSHPKADYESEILVFVSGYNDPIKYISSPSNVVLVANDDQYHDFQVLLVNGAPEDVINFVYEIYEGADVIDIVSNETVCNVMGKKSGTAIIRVKHPLAVMDFDVRIFVYNPAVPFITLEKTFLLMSIGESVNIAAQVENAKNAVAASGQFEFSKIESVEDVVEVVQNNNYFFIRANKGGMARVVVSNEQSEMSREILVIVRDENIYRDDYYITTTQNVITTQVGATNIQLNMQLINGNTADANGFEWVIEDGTIVELDSAHGIVRENRAMINSVFNAVALITAKKAGVTKITIAHPKAESSVSVLVKVYPKGTFSETPIIIGLRDTTTPPASANNPVTGLFHIGGSGPASRTISAYTLSGDILDVGNLDWKTNDPNWATVQTGVHGLTNILSAVPGQSGLTKIVVTGNNLEFPHESLVAVDMPNASIIYVDNVYQIIAEQQVVNIEVKDSQNAYANSTDFTVKVEKPELLYAVMIKNRLMLQGKQRGETKVIIDHPSAINDITLNVRVEPASINIDKPYYIGGPEIVGVVRGYATDVNVTLAGAGVSEEGKLEWSIEDSSVATIVANGTKAIVTGRVSNQQTKLWIKHRDNKSENDKMILLYVVENEADLYNKVVLALESENYLMVSGENKLISLITNASESQKAGLKWTIKQDNGNVVDGNYENSVIRIEENFSSAMVYAKAAGNAEIVVRHPDNILPLSIYVSVVDGLTGEKQVKSPAIIELLTGIGKIVGLSTLNLTQGEKAAIQWEMESGSGTLANVEGNGDSGYILGLKEGVGYLNISQSGLGYKHRATVVCADTPERLASMYIIGMEESYHVLKVGDEKKVQLIFGSNGFPEDKKSGLQWKADGSGSVSVSGQGDKAVIIAKAVGDAVVTVTDPSKTALNSTFEIKVSVRSNVGSLEFRDYDKIVGIVRGNSKQVTVKLFEGSDEVKTGYSHISYYLEDRLNTQFEDVQKNSSIITVNQANNIFDIVAKSAGESKVKITHPQVNDPAVILVYTANTQAELDAYYPIVADKTNYLLQVNETAVITVTTIDSKDSLTNGSGQSNVSRIRWNIENAGIVSMSGSLAKERTIKGLTAGLSIISIDYDGKTIERIFVTVVENEDIDMRKYIVTENIIGLVKGQSKQTKIHSNLTASEISSLQWESSDPTIVKVSGSGDTVTLLAQNVSGNVNEAYVTVSYGSWLKRHILVYVCQDDTTVNAYKAMNMDDQYYRMGRNETITLPVFFAPVKTTVPTIWADKYGNNVVKFTEFDGGSKIDVTSMNEGVAVLEAMNTGLSNTGCVLRIYIEVSNRYNDAARAIRTGYLTSLKTIYLLNPQDAGAEVTLNVTGIGMDAGELSKVKWSVKEGTNIVSIVPSGPNCVVRHRGLELSPPNDTATIQAVGVDNIVEFKVIVSTRELLGIPHIVGDDVIKVGLNGKITASYQVAEMTGVDNSRFTFQVVQNPSIVGITFAGNTVEVTGLSSGQALLKAKYNDAAVPYEKDILVVVTTTADGMVYLTTRDNFNVLRQGEYKTLTVEMVGFNNPGDTGYTWTVAPESADYISLDINSSGRQAQVKGEKAGTAKIIVSNRIFNNDRMYDLVMYVRVSEFDMPTAYMTTQQNIISVTSGSTTLVEMELVGGNPLQAEAFDFSSLDTTIFTVTQAGSRALIKGESVGNGRLQVRNSNALNDTMTLFVVVQPVKDDNGIYIVSDYTIVDVKPNETRNISVRLINGKPTDNYLFDWKIGIQNSIIKNSSGGTLDVIQLPPSSNANNAIKGINEGEATIIVTNIACPGYELHIRVYVRETSVVQFSIRNLTLTVGETMYIPLTAPSGTVVMYESKDPRVVFVSPSTGQGALSTNQLCYVRAEGVGTTIVTAKSSSGTSSDDIIIEVIPKPVSSLGYISTPDVIYNMTDWQSSANRLVVVGTPVGNKNTDGVPFNVKDEQTIYWEIDEPEKNIIGFGLNSAKTDEELKNRQIREYGKMANIYSLKPGLGKILVSHDAFMSGEMVINGSKVKTINKDVDNFQTLYVNVSPYDANFNITPMFIQAQTGQVVSVTAKISNLIQEDYERVVWSISPEGAAKFVTVDVGGVEQDVTKVPYSGESKVSVKVLGSESFNIRAGYDGRTTLESVVYVEKEKYLRLLSENSFIQLLPNADAYIPFEVEPIEFSEIKEWQESTRFSRIVRIAEKDKFKTGDMAKFYDGVTIDEGNNSAYGKIDWNFIPDEATHILHVRSTNIDGFNKIEIRAHNNTITRMITVETNHRYMFQLADMPAVRGHPGETIRIHYLVKNDHDPVTYLHYENPLIGFPPDNGLLSFDPNPNSINFGKEIKPKIDSDSQWIDFTLGRTGYLNYIFSSEYNEPSGIRLTVPVYSYYDNIPLNWILRNNNINNKSRMDIAQNAIYVANRESIEVTVDRNIDQLFTGVDGDAFYKDEGYILGRDEKKYFQIINLEGDFSQNTIDGNKGSVSIIGGSAGKGINLSYGGGVIDKVQNKNLKEVNFAGTLTVKYSYYTGGKKPTEFKKVFLVYAEIWD